MISTRISRFNPFMHKLLPHTALDIIANLLATKINLFTESKAK